MNSISDGLTLSRTLRVILQSFICSITRTKSSKHHGRVAFLPYVRVNLKVLRKKPYDFEPQSLGERIKKKRLELGLTQQEAGQLMGVNPSTVLHWESCHTIPHIACIPAILQFLGYDPFPAPQTLPECLFALRRSKGWSIRDAAKAFGVGPGTWRDWECGKTILYRHHRELIARLLGLPLEKIHQEMGVQWNQSHSKKSVAKL